ncbi:tripartite tricarboxylate transporter TctB family protein [Achromobacter sp. AGC25]
MSGEDLGFRASVSALLSVGTVLFIGAGVLWINADSLPPAGAMGVGPSAALRLVSGLLLVLALAHYVIAWRTRAVQIDRSDRLRTDRFALAWGVGGLVAMIAIVALDGGFVVAATVLFVATAKAFGKPIGVMSIGIGLILSVVASLFFTELLTLSLPAGWVESILYMQP